MTREFVQSLREQGTSLGGVLHRTGDLMRLLRQSGEVPDERGRLESEVMRWAAEEFCAAA
jgi:hypothetical protein